MRIFRNKKDELALRKLIKECKLNHTVESIKRADNLSFKNLNLKKIPDGILLLNLKNISFIGNNIEDISNLLSLKGIDFLLSMENETHGISFDKVPAIINCSMGNIVRPTSKKENRKNLKLVLNIFF